VPTDFAGFTDEPSRIEGFDRGDGFDRMSSEEIQTLQPSYYQTHQSNIGFGQSANAIPGSRTNEFNKFDA